MNNVEELEPFSRVSSYDEWTELEEVVVGVAEGSIFPNERPETVEATMPSDYWGKFDGSPFPSEVLEGAANELNNLAAVLADEGIVVRRSDVIDWAAVGGHTGAMARDPLLVVGSRIIEAPMAWRSRQKEILAYKRLLTDYEASGATWVRAPRANPDLLLQKGQDDDTVRNDPWVINNTAPAFDAADFMRFGKDIVGQLSNVTNYKGVDWLQSQVGDECRVHVVEFDDPHAMHIDASITPLRKGLMMYNPLRVDPFMLKDTLFADWELIETPKPELRTWPPLYMTSAWVNMNILVLGDDRVVIEEHDEPVTELLEKYGFRVIKVPFRHVHSLGGSIHCATLDIRRRGQLSSYLSR